MGLIDIFTPIHKAILLMMYEVGKALQTATFTEECAGKVIVSKLNHEFS